MHGYERVGEWMVRNRVITEEQLHRALTARSQTRHRFGDVLVELGFCTDRDVLECLASQFALPIVDPTTLRPKPSITKRISGSFALHRLVLPIDIVEGTLRVVVADPVDIDTTDVLQQKFGVPVSMSLMSASELRQWIRKSYRLPGWEATKKQTSVRLDDQADKRALLVALEQEGEVA